MPETAVLLPDVPKGELLRDGILSSSEQSSGTTEDAGDCQYQSLYDPVTQDGLPGVMAARRSVDTGPGNKRADHVLVNDDGQSEHQANTPHEVVENPLHISIVVSPAALRQGFQWRNRDAMGAPSCEGIGKGTKMGSATIDTREGLYYICLG